MAATNDHVRELRERKGWSQDELAKKCGWTQYRVSRIETGKTALSLEDMKTVARVFGVPVSRLIKMAMQPGAA
jgi:transcriptional regulator with XRE-family HTH domain